MQSARILEHFVTDTAHIGLSLDRSEPCLATLGHQGQNERSMALTECPDCQGKVSSLAPTCPHCGYPLGGTPSIYWPDSAWGRTLLLAWLFLCLVAGFAAPVLAGLPRGDEVGVIAAVGSAGLSYLITVGFRALVIGLARVTSQSDKKAVQADATDWANILVGVVLLMTCGYVVLFMLNELRGVIDFAQWIRRILP